MGPSTPRARGLSAGAGAALILGPLLAGLALGAASAHILGAEVVPVDREGDGLFDYLNVTMTLDVPQAGSYLVSGALHWPVTGTLVASNSSLVSLAAGPAQFTLRIEGAAVAEKQLDGPYNLTLDLLSSPSGPVRDSASFTTPTMRARDFKAQAPGDKPVLNVGPSDVQLASPAINASVSLTRPTVAWGPRAGGGGAPAFEASFPSAVAFADDGDSAFEPGEVLCRADLTRGSWSIAALEVASSPALGSTIRFTLASRVSFEGGACSPAVAANVTLAFLISERSGVVGDTTPFPLAGGLEVKVDMAVAPQGPLPGSGLAFEVALRDLAQNHSFLVRGPSGYEKVEGAQARAVAPLAPASPSDVERVAFVDGSGVPRGHFAWLALAKEELTSGELRTVRVSASEGLANGSLSVFLAVPNDAALKAATLDPAVGVAGPVTAPPVGGQRPPPPPERPSAVVFVAALAAVSAMFFFSVYARAKRD